LNNLIAQDHRRIKQRIRPMLGFKGFETAAVTIRGIKRRRKSTNTNSTSNPWPAKKPPLRKLGPAVLAA